MTNNTTPVRASQVLTANAYTPIYNLPLSAISAVVNARFVSLDLTKDSKIGLAVVPNGADLSTIDTKYYNQPVGLVLGPNGISIGIVEDTGIVLCPGDTVVMFSDTDLVVGHVHGFIRLGA